MNSDKERLDFLEQNKAKIIYWPDESWSVGALVSSNPADHGAAPNLREAIDNYMENRENEYKCRHCGSDKGSFFSRIMPMGNFCENCGKPWTESDGVE